MEVASKNVVDFSDLMPTKSKFCVAFSVDDKRETQSTLQCLTAIICQEGLYV